MTSTTARLTVLEAVVSRLADRRGAKISDMLRQARQRVQAGETPTHPGLHDLGELEREATRGGIAGRMARARLRLLQDPAPDALPVPGVERQDARGGGEGQGGDDASSVDRFSTPPAVAVAGHSVVDREQLLQRIDATLARANGQV